MQSRDGTFRAQLPVTRQELAVMLQRAMAYAGESAAVGASEQEGILAPFGDRAAIADWAADAVGVQVKLGVIQGFEDGTFQPDASADRGQAAVMLYRTLAQLKFEE
ncbi:MULTISPECIES: S-layer homology domain-containing protein [Paenibacillus]|uniref:S-layer homology domain-containing protein n=1 Tax=Paenibacillus TaxID=44249 RepID=UPI0022B8D60C|nr:S-layer homology domain-containing protein [Paenibacillus caseinilyticus]MCZ8521789.1 S-layer homology domain-containing protein [Paenibacillus caseinilyticus]